jgi:flagellar biosynthesis/type III secretory pathway protein FliH
VTDAATKTTARILRAERRGPAVVPRAIVDATARAEAIVARARTEAEQVLRDANEQGRAEGRAECANLLLELSRRRDTLLREFEPEVIKLAAALAKRIVAEQLALEPERIAAMAEPLLARVRRARRVTLRVHPYDRHALEARLPALVAGASLSGSVQLEVDPALSRGDCVVISDAGVLDARVDTQLRALTHALGAE